jgi:hypothetical protein
VKASRLAAAASSSAAASGKALLELVGDPMVLLVHGPGVGLGEDRPDDGRNEGLDRFRDAGQQVAHEVGATPLPACAGQRCRDRVDEPGVVRVRGDEAYAAEATGDERAQGGEPGGAVLGGDDLEAERLAEAVAVDGDRVHDAGVDRPAALAALDLERVEDEVWGRTPRRADAVRKSSTIASRLLASRET